jgi:membrane-associated tyrosine/threonine-specific cdc2-inhibitory kinase
VRAGDVSAIEPVSEPGTPQAPALPQAPPLQPPHSTSAMMMMMMRLGAGRSDHGRGATAGVDGSDDSAVMEDMCGGGGGGGGGGGSSSGGVGSSSGGGGAGALLSHSSSSSSLAMGSPPPLGRGLLDFGASPSPPPMGSAVRGAAPTTPVATTPVAAAAVLVPVLGAAGSPPRLPPGSPPPHVQFSCFPASSPCCPSPRSPAPRASDGGDRSGGGGGGSLGTSFHRPMPDLTAFDSSRALSYAKKKSPTPQSSPICPPTPLRTPIWASAPRLERTSSLMGTKTLVSINGGLGGGGELGSGSAFGGAEFGSDSNSSDMGSDDGGAGGAGGGAGRRLGGGLVGGGRAAAGSMSATGGVGPIGGGGGGAAVSGARRDIRSFAAEFEVFGCVGAGSFSEVYRVRCRSTGLPYAVKKAKRQFRSKRDRARQLEEVKVSEVLGGCANIVRVVCCWQEGGFLFTQLELCERGNLKMFLDELEAHTPPLVLPETTIWSIVSDVATALAHVHAHSFVHLDVKPQNIFISRAGVLKLGDFGMTSSEGHMEDGLEGDDCYMARELLNAGSKKSASADIFSLGIVLFELASEVERLPRDGEFWHDLRSDRAPPLAPGRSDELNSLTREMMHSDPARRPTAQNVLLHPMIKGLLERDTFIASVSVLCLRNSAPKAARSHDAPFASVHPQRPVANHFAQISTTPRLGQGQYRRPDLILGGGGFDADADVRRDLHTPTESINWALRSL